MPGSFSFTALSRRRDLLTSSRKWHGYNSAAVGTRRITSAILKDIFKHFFPPAPAVRRGFPWLARRCGRRFEPSTFSRREIPLAFYCLAFTPSFLRFLNSVPSSSALCALPAYLLLVLAPRSARPEIPKSPGHLATGFFHLEFNV